MLKKPQKPLCNWKVASFEEQLKANFKINISSLFQEQDKNSHNVLPWKYI